MKNNNGYLYTVDTSMLDKNGVITPEGYQRIVITVTERELKRINMEIATLIKTMGVSWVLLSLTVKIFKRILPGQELCVKTHHTWQKGVLYRRDFEISCPITGEIIAYAVTFSSLLDVEKRRICMDKSVYEKLSLDENEELFEAQSRRAINGNFEFLEEVAVRPSWIDSLGHVNNFKYGALTYDDMPEEYKQNLANLTRLEMFFIGELRQTDSVKISNRVEEGYLEVCGERAIDGKPAFLTRMKFD